MSIEGGPAAFLGALGIAALAGGLAYGAHMIIPASDNGADPGSSPIAMSDDFCALMDEMAAYTAALNSSDAGSDIPMDETSWDDPAILEAMHSSGQDMLDAIGPVTGFANHAAELVTDPDVAAAFGTLARVTEAELQALGQIALDAVSVEAYMTALFATMGDADLTALAAEGDAANAVVQQYVVATCGRDILGGGLFGGSDSGGTVDTGGDTSADTDSTEEAVKADVSWLGDLMVSYYSNWEVGDPQPEFVASGDGYEFDGGSLGWSDEGIDITDQYANGPDDWCVEVTATAEPENPWTYSAQSGLAQGTCQ